MRPLVTAVLLTVTAGAGLAACDILDPSQPGNLVPRTVDEDPSLPSLALAGTLFHYETFGDASKPVIIFLHGGPGGDYRDQLRLTARYDGYALTDDHFLVLWDQRGSGLSRRHDCGVYNLERMDADLDALVDHVSPGRPVFLVGHSSDGCVAVDAGRGDEVQRAQRGPIQSVTCTLTCTCSCTLTCTSDDHVHRTLTCSATCWSRRA